MKNINLVGIRFGRLVVTKFEYVKDNKRYWHCECDCGNASIVPTSKLRSGNSTSCGCLRYINAGLAVRTHGETSNGEMTHLYRVWNGMRSRCRRNGPLRYGGRGIIVCDEWLDFITFAKWARENGYATNLEIDRIDNDGNYEPDNCHWITRRENILKQKQTKWITIWGETKALTQWAEDPRCRVGILTLRARIVRSNWNPERAMITPPQGAADGR